MYVHEQILFNPRCETSPRRAWSGKGMPPERVHSLDP
jgi:hypothetical protein